MALALALLSLLMMTALLLPLLSMSSTEVQIAANLTAAAQARQCAEAGLEYALSEMNVPGGAPFLSSTIDVNGNDGGGPHVHLHPRHRAARQQHRLPELRARSLDRPVVGQGRHLPGAVSQPVDALTGAGKSG